MSTKHTDCWRGEPCHDNDPATCPAVQAEARRAEARQGAWAKLSVVNEWGSERHYLDGEPIHCGEPLELQAIECRSDNYGEYEVLLQRGRSVRYELVAPFAGGSLGVRARLHVGLDGHEFVAAFDAGMTFRWPSQEASQR